MIQSRGPALPSHVVERVEQFLGSADRLGAIERLPLQRLVKDYCEKFIALDVDGRPVAFIAVSPASHPDSVRQASDSARAIQAALGAGLGAAVLAPWAVGDLDGQSYSITAYCTPVSSQLWRSRWERLRMSPGILAWLAGITRRTAAPIEDLDDRVRAPLQALSATVVLDDVVRHAADAALDDLERGRWQPRAVVAHNDLWWGNVVHRSRLDQQAPAFRIIDWAGGSMHGAPFYDLVRLSLSLHQDRRHLRRELLLHAAILGCRPAHSVHYLCTALGDLTRHMGEWPPDELAATARSCLAHAQGGLV